MANALGSPKRIDFGSLWLSTWAVRTIADIRHANLLLLIHRVGTVKSLAEKLDRSYGQVSQLKNRSKHSKTGQPRDIGDDMARHIEARLDLQVGWMDQDRHNAWAPAAVVDLLAAREPTPHLPMAWPFRRVSPAAFFKLSETDRGRVEGYVESLVAAAGFNEDQSQAGAV